MLGIVNYEHPHPLDTVFSPKSLSVDSDEGIQDSLNQFDNHKVHRITFSPLLLDKLSRFCKAQIMKESSAIFSKHSTCVVKMFIKSRMCLYETRRQQGTVSWVAKRIDYL